LITHLLPPQLDAATATLTAAFDADPIYTYTFPAARDRARYLPPFWRAILRNAMLHGHVYTTTEADGVALWMPPGRHPVAFGDSARIGFAFHRAVAMFPAAARRRFMAYVTYGDGVQQRLLGDSLYWELWVLGIRPERQGQGLGGQLLEPILNRADDERFPCYLLTESERNVAFYRKHGFDVAHEGDVPGHPLRLWMMIRQPR